MTPERYQALCALFEGAEGLLPTERARFLAEACADPTLRAEAERFLADADAARQEHFLTPPFPPPADAPEGEVSDDLIGGRLGPYAVRARLGSGGMGNVYRAERLDPYRQDVAVKVIRPGLVSAEVLRRFRNERQVLAALNHPHIARLLDGGTTDDGLPFLVMEYVDGERLDHHCARLGLTTRDRLRLFGQVCAAVQYAHQHTVVHRDLKPGNILVDRSGQVKVLDFGVARVTGSDLQATTAATGCGQLVGTLPYMSPEQVAAQPAGLDTRSDVYALGVVCYELLAGRLPYDLKGKSLPEAARAIGEAGPLPLGTADRTLRGDLEVIVAKALEKDPARRYQSASELAADMERYLRDEPIAARPPGSVYQLRKFARRHRALVGATAAVLVALVLGVIGTSIGLYRAQASARQARRAVNDYFHLVSGSKPLRQPGFEPLRKELLETALRYYAEFEQQCGRDRALQEDVAYAYLVVTQIDQQLGMYDEAEAAVRRAVALYEVLARDEPHSLDDLRHLGFAYEELGRTLGYLGRPEEELRAYEKALEVRQRFARLDQTAAGPGCLGLSCTNLGVFYAERGQTDKARAYLDQGHAHWRRLLEIDPNNTWGQSMLGSSCLNLGELSLADNRLDEAVHYFEECRRARAALVQANPKDPALEWDLSDSHARVGKVHDRAGRAAEALRAFEQVRDVQERISAANPPCKRFHDDLSATYALLARLQRASGQVAEAAATTRKRARLWPDDGPELYNAACELALCVPLTSGEGTERRRCADDALALLRQALDKGFADRKRLNEDQALAPLRARPEFGDLLRRLEGKAIQTRRNSRLR
jgi:tetratricopeptide (TPR) repeat protein